MSSVRRPKIGALNDKGRTKRLKKYLQSLNKDLLSDTDDDKHSTIHKIQIFCSDKLTFPFKQDDKQVLSEISSFVVLFVLKTFFEY